MTASQRHLLPSGFTFLEILAALVILAFLVSMVASKTRGRMQDSEIIAALSQMNSIKEAVVNGFYADFGFVPEEVHQPDQKNDIEAERNQNPEYATRFLCLKKDCTDEEIKAALVQHPLGPWYFTLEEHILGNGYQGCYFMARFLNSLVGQKQIYDYEMILPLMRDPTIERGWSGPYLEANGQFNATALNREDAEKYPDIFYSDAATVKKDVLFPVITTPWADGLEASALTAETEGDPALAAELRKGRYYQILVYSTYRISRYGGGAMPFGRWEQVQDTAVVLCRGADGLSGSDEQAERQGAEDYWRQCEEMTQFGLTDEQRRCFDRLKITDPNNPDYVDIGDDMILFIFGSGPVRSPLRK